MKKALLIFLAFAAAVPVADAQVKNRWRLHWRNDKPRIFTFRHPNDRHENYWYFTYTVENLTEEIVPVIVNALLYTERGKELQHDVRHVDSPTLAEETAQPLRAEHLKYGRFYANVIDAEAEYAAIEFDAKIGNRSPGIVREIIEGYKKGFTREPPEEMEGRWKIGDRIYLNPREMRNHRFIQPGQRLMGIAIFKNVDPRAHVYEIHVSGLVDIVKVIAINEDEWRMEYEPHTLKVRYFRTGDPFEIENDIVLRQPKAPEYVIKKIGPIAGKDTIDKLVMSLADTLKKESDWKEQNLGEEDLGKRRAIDGIDALDTRVMAMAFKQATEKDFGYDPEKDVLGNEDAVWRIHEWWIANRGLLLFNEATNRFEPQSEVLPATIKQ